MALSTVSRLDMEIYKARVLILARVSVSHNLMIISIGPFQDQRVLFRTVATIRDNAMDHGLALGLIIIFQFPV